jgi:hypothetical protein
MCFIHGIFSFPLPGGEYIESEVYSGLRFVICFILMINDLLIQFIITNLINFKHIKKQKR